jgi:transposase InsO family protein
MEVISDLVVQMARENPGWGYMRIQGALNNVGHRVGRTTVADILKRNGIDPAPERGRRMTGPRGLVTLYVFFLIELATRRIEIAGVTPGPNEAWMIQIGRNLTDPVDGFLADKKFVILDRDSKCSAAFRDLLNGSGIEVVRLPPRSPNLNAHAERFVRSIKYECLNRMIFFGERSLRKATQEFAAHYHTERNHQGLNNRLIEPDGREALTCGKVECVQRLGGTLRFYRRAAA